MVGVDVYFCGSRMQVIGFMQEVAKITFADDKRSPRDWFNPADSTALTPARRLVESDLRQGLTRGRERVGAAIRNSKSVIGWSVLLRQGRDRQK